MLTQYQLKNKLKVLLVESHKAPVVAIQMWVKTGSADEKKGEEGISHFIEHLVFKGTRKFGVGEVAKTVEGSGGELNAYTTFDHTVFHVTMSQTDLEVGLDCIAEMMGFPKFDPVEIDKEREVVIEEIKRSFDNPGAVAGQQLFSTAFKKHPYGIPVIGFDKNIRKVSPKVLQNYYHRRYVPSNMTLVVAGDFDRKTIKKQIDNFYAGFKAYGLKRISRAQDPKQTKPLTNYLKTEFQEAALNLAFKVPGANHADVPALDVLGFVLGQGDSSRLVRRLRLEQSLVTSIHVGSYNPMDQGVFNFSLNFKPEKLTEIQKVLEEEVFEVLTSPLTVADLGRASLNLEAEEVFSLETVDGLARKVGVFQTFMKDPEYIKKYLKRIHSLQPSDILKVARKYFTPQNLTATLMISKDDSKALTEKQFKTYVDSFGSILKKAQKTKVAGKMPKRTTGKSMKAQLKISGAASDIVKHRLDNGALVILKKNSEVPIFHMKAGFLGGLRTEEISQLGATALLSNTWTSGSKNYSEAEIASIIEGCAGSVSAFGGRNSIGLTAESLTAHEKEAKDIFTDVLTAPLFPQDAVAREAGQQLEHLRTRGDHPSSVAVQAFLENIFKGHPYGLDLMGTMTSIAGLDSQKIQNHWKKMATASNAIFVGVGDFNVDKQLKYFEGLSKSLGQGKSPRQTFPIAPLTENIRLFSKSDKEQSHIIVGYRGLSFKDPDRYTLEVLQAILAGQGGRLFLELRDKASLAYTVSPVHMNGIETGYFGVYIGCSPEKGKKAIQMIHQELDRIVSTEPSEAEVDRAKRYLIGRNHIDLQRNGSQASSILFDELYGIDCEETFRYAEHLKNVTAAGVQKLARRIFTGPNVTSVVGPVEPF